MKTEKSAAIVNQMSLKLPALSRNESICRAVVAAFIAQADPTLEEIADIKCAVSEAFTNAIVHAYRESEKTGIVYISVCLYGDNKLKISIRDTGCGIPDVKKARQPLYTTDNSGDRSGMGFSVMETFTDRLSVFSRVGKGTRVTMLKKLS